MIKKNYLCIYIYVISAEVFVLCTCLKEGKYASSDFVEVDVGTKNVEVQNMMINKFRVGNIMIKWLYYDKEMEVDFDIEGEVCESVEVYTKYECSMNDLMYLLMCLFLF
jgi:hypothetical protein